MLSDDVDKVRLHETLSVDERDNLDADLKEWREFNRRSRQMERELAKAASAGLFLTAADLRDE